MLSDLRIAFRSLLKNRTFTVVAVLCLALGIGVNAAIFSIVNALLLRPFPYERPEEIVAIYSGQPKAGFEEWGISHADMADWRAGTPALQDVGLFHERSFALAGGAGAGAVEAERLEGWGVSPNLFGMLGVRPALGRGFLPEEARAGSERVIVVSHELWQRRFGAEPSAVGAKLLLDGVPYTVVGVMPPRFKFPETGQVWVPIVPPTAAEPRSERYLHAVGRLAAGATVETAQRQLDAVARRLAAEHSATNAGWVARVMSYRDDHVEGPLRQMLYLMLGAVGFVLLIACANVANLLLARATTRQREIALRMALGAGRWRLVRQMLSESVLLALMGGALGVLIAVWWIDATVASIPEELPFWITFDVDATVLLYTLVLSVVMGLVFGALPALRASAGTMHGTLKDEGRGGTGGARRQRLRNALVTGELALSVVLLVGATLMIKTFVAMSRADAGFDESRILTLRTYTAGERYAGVPARAAYLEQLVARLEALPGVRRAVATSSIPTDDGGPPTTVIAEGRQVAPGDETAAQYFGSTPGLFEALGQPMLHGRGFTAEEARDSAARVVVLNKALAERLWPGQSAVGRRLRVPEVDSTAWLTVVGVARGLHYEEVGEESAQSRLQVHLPYARLGWRSMAVLVRTAGDPAPVAPAVRRQLRALDPTLPAYDVRTMAEVRHFTTWPNRLYSGVFGSFAAVAVLLAAIGVYGVMAYAVSQRAREIGIRMALGARGGDVLRMIVRQGARLAAAGVALGVGLALVVSRALSGVLYGVSAYDPLAFLAIPLLLAAVAVLASWLPARRATRVDPVVVLRAE